MTQIVWGRTSDRNGRKRILTLTPAAAALNYVAFAYTAHFGLVLAIRILTGFFSSAIGVCQSYIADVTKPQERASSIGHLGAAGFRCGWTPV
jgi:DHA1 family tetracycline resistance protein-like MFS transporter